MESGQGQQFVDLLRTCWRTRAYGDFWSYMLLAEGGVDLACEPELALHDMAACSIIVTEAGGAFTDLDGRPGPLGAGGYASNGRLHDALLEQLRPGSSELPRALTAPSRPSADRAQGCAGGQDGRTVDALRPTPGSLRPERPTGRTRRSGQCGHTRRGRPAG